MTDLRPAFMRLEGDAFERGHQHGVARRAAIADFLAEGLARLDAFLPVAPSLLSLTPQLHAFASAIERQTPALWREIEGLAEGAGIAIEAATLLQVRRELAGYSRFDTGGDCTTFARSGEASIVAQTIDLAADVEDQVCVLESRDEASGRGALLVSFTGLLGYLGLNDRGLAIGLNLVLGGEWRAGLPPYLAIRHLLDTAESVDDAVERLHRLDLASSRAFMLCDGRSAAMVEAVDGAFRVTRGAELAHANHFLASDFVHRDEINVFSANGSRRRLQACQSWLATRPVGLGPGDAFELLATEPVLVPGTGDRRREKTVAAVVMEPDRGVLHLRCGDPRVAGTLRFTLGSDGGGSAAGPSRQHAGGCRP